MTYIPNKFSHLSDAEFAKVARHEHDELTCTEVQAELLQRFERALDEDSRFDELLSELTNLIDNGSFNRNAASVLKALIEDFQP